MITFEEIDVDSAMLHIFNTSTQSCAFSHNTYTFHVVSGFNVYPASIEEVISKHPLVSKVCVIGIPHPYKMHVPKAIIVLSSLLKIKAMTINAINIMIISIKHLFSIYSFYQK